MTLPHYFFAVPLPAKIRSEINQWTKTAQSQLLFKKWVHPQDYHITLLFLGAADEKTLQLFIKEADRVAEDFAAFPLTLTEPGVFGKVDSPRILHIGVEKSERLQKLQHHLSHHGETLGFRQENRPYRPHITVARKWDRKEPFSKSELPLIQSNQWQVDTFSLFQTHLNRTPKYEEIHSIKLNRML
ncbi:RNA 2',3'-cyclic phosphodiesterase [Alteribacillus iranensis]|uniref:RNA 2',3'-cyclic phosphodiesterase n=1 Tax=Alteribacillus iranensis TaxID=930128 RepID=A0A1I2ESG4_9BACI|nr:RNA 2',3'-cyclic phosphodiesterase [Alteribacillus iranensis]SFE95416.1 2'-5' RNA ligase [Alteribacillus iranensis]